MISKSSYRNCTIIEGPLGEFTVYHPDYRSKEFYTSMFLSDVKRKIDKWLDDAK